MVFLLNFYVFLMIFNIFFQFFFNPFFGIFELGWQCSQFWLRWNNFICSKWLSYRRFTKSILPSLQVENVTAYHPSTIYRTMNFLVTTESGSKSKSIWPIIVSKYLIILLIQAFQVNSYILNFFWRIESSEFWWKWFMILVTYYLLHLLI